MPGLAVIVMPRHRPRNERRRVERENAEALGDAYKFTRDPDLAEERRQLRRDRHEVEGKRWVDFHRGKWAKCLAPGCKFQARVRLIDDIDFPICSIHAVAIWESVNKMIDEPWATDSIVALRARRDGILLEREHLLEQENTEAKEYLKSADAQGDIYYCRIGDLIKVGWSSELYRRIYSYGPGAELLANYPATRADEAALHRNLRPSRAKGNEWYHDDAVIQAFIALALREYGKPNFQSTRWTEANPIVAGKRAMRSA